MKLNCYLAGSFTTQFFKQTKKKKKNMSQEKINQIKEKISTIKQNIDELVNKTHPILPKFEERCVNIVNERHRSINEYKEQEIRAAHKLYEGMAYGIDSDYENSLSLLENHIKKHIIFKKDFLCKEFPEFSDYVNKFTDIPFFESVNDFINVEKEKISQNESAEVSLSEGPLLSQDQLDKCLNELINNKNYHSENGILYKGDSPFLKVGDNISFQMKELNPYNGIINQIEKDFIFIDTKKSIKVPIIALNLGFIAITTI